MINNDRIVPVSKTDLLTLYSAIFAIASVTISKLTGTDGEYQVKSAPNALICDEPVRVLDIDSTASSVTSATVYFLAAHDFKGVSIDGTIVEPEDGSAEVIGGSGQLYKAVLSSGDITITTVGF